MKLLFYIKCLVVLAWLNFRLDILRIKSGFITVIILHFPNTIVYFSGVIDKCREEVDYIIDTAQTMADKIAKIMQEVSNESKEH